MVVPIAKNITADKENLIAEEYCQLIQGHRDTMLDLEKNPPATAVEAHQSLIRAGLNKGLFFLVVEVFFSKERNRRQINKYTAILAQVEMKSVDSIKKHIGALSEEIKKEIAAVKNGITAVDNKITAVDNKITALQNEIAEVKIEVESLTFHLTGTQAAQQEYKRRRM